MLAVSGGPDSMAMLLLAHQHAPGRISAATVDHRLRPESPVEAIYVSGICTQLCIPHLTLVPAGAIGGNIQSSARAARYALLEKAAHENDCALIATAHHADDQLETLLMRLARGSGVSGMAGIRPRFGRIIRPLLDFSKAELEEICAASSVEPVRDPSNHNADFDRVAMRQWLSMNEHPFDIVATNRTASAMDNAFVALDWMTNQLGKQRITADGSTIFFNYNDLPHELQRRLLLMAVQRIEPRLAPRGEAIERLIVDLKAGKTSMIGNILCTGGDVWRFAPAPPRRTQS